jgi:S1-C subfamily serine protease
MLENPCPLVRAGSEDPASVEGSPIAIVLTLAQMDQSLATDPLMLQELQRRSSAERSAKRAEVSSQHLPVISPAEHRQSATGSDIRGVPYFESGRAIGQRVFALRDGSLYERIGLRNGDIVTEVDGEPVSSSSRLSEMFPSDLKQGEAVTIVVLRSGERVTLGYRLGSK